MQIRGGGKAAQSAVTGGAATADGWIASRRQDYTSIRSASKRSNVSQSIVFDLFEAVPNMMVSCSDGSASPHTSVTSNWTALPPNLHFDTSSLFHFTTTLNISPLTLAIYIPGARFTISAFEPTVPTHTCEPCNV